MSKSPDNRTISPKREEPPISVFLSDFSFTTEGNTDFHLYHHHERLQLVYVLRGNVRCRLSFETIEIGKNGVLLIGSHQMHLLKADPDSEYLSVLFSSRQAVCRNSGEVSVSIELMQRLNNTDWILWKPDVLDAFQISLMQEMAEKRKKSESYLYQCLLTLSLASLLECSPERKSGKTDDSEYRFQTMVRTIETRYPDHNLSLKDIAESARISISEALRCFKKAADITPIRYLMEYRIAQASALLRESSESVTEISFVCGFSQPSYFGKQFRSFYGCTPLEYRKRFRVLKDTGKSRDWT